jgi:Replication protein
MQQTHPQPHCRAAPKTGDAGTPAFSSSVQPLETSVQRPDALISSEHYEVHRHQCYFRATPAEQSFRHSGWAMTRAKVFEGLRRTHQPAKRLVAFANCGSQMHLMTDGTDLWVSCNHCHDRLCVPCQIARRQKLTDQITSRCLDLQKSVRFLTLTQAHNSTPLCSQIRRLLTNFHTLRRRNFWKAAVRGGAAFVEIKLGKNGTDWHVHLHCLIEGDYLDQKTLSREWLAVTGDSSIVDIRKIDDPAQKASYVTKYATKPLDREVVNSPDHLDEAIHALKGARLYNCFGTWKSLANEETDEKRTGRDLGSPSELQHRARCGDAEAIRWLEAAQRKWPLFKPLFAIPRPEPPHPDPL